MRKILEISLILLLLFNLQCAMASYTQTGKSFSPLPENAQVDVIMRAVPDYKVQQIGIVKLEGGTMNQQIEKAKKIARENGGDVIILAEVGTGLNVNQGQATTYEIRTFEISKKVASE